MFFRMIVSGFLAISLLAITSAYANDDTVPCPLINKIKQAAQKVKAVSMIDNYYAAFTLTSAFKESDRNWFIIVDKISTNSYDKAIFLGRKAIPGASIQKQVNSNKGSYGALSGDICTYGPGDIIALGVNA